MDAHEFISYVREPGKLGRETLVDIEKLANDFPYCQSLKILHLLNLRMINHVMYSEQLKSTAAHISDRKRLKELIHNFKDEKVTIADEKPEPIIAAVEVEEIEEVEKVEVPTPTNTVTYGEPIVPIIEQDEESRLRALKEIVENRLKEITGDKEDEAEEQPSKEDLINKFIKEQPSISRPRADFFDPVKVAKSSQQEQEGRVSETLARIHIQQGNIEKAIEIYHKLSLNFPEKSPYFASQIKKISTEN